MSLCRTQAIVMPTDVPYRVLPTDRHTDRSIKQCCCTHNATKRNFPLSSSKWGQLDVEHRSGCEGGEEIAELHVIPILLSVPLAQPQFHLPYHPHTSFFCHVVVPADVVVLFVVPTASDICLVQCCGTKCTVLFPLLSKMRNLIMRCIME